MQVMQAIGNEQRLTVVLAAHEHITMPGIPVNRFAAIMIAAPAVNDHIRQALALVLKAASLEVETQVFCTTIGSSTVMADAHPARLDTKEEPRSPQRLENVAFGKCHPHSTGRQGIDQSEDLQLFGDPHSQLLRKGNMDGTALTDERKAIAMDVGEGKRAEDEVLDMLINDRLQLGCDERCHVVVVSSDHNRFVHRCSRVMFSLLLVRADPNWSWYHNKGISTLQYRGYPSQTSAWCIAPMAGTLYQGPTGFVVTTARTYCCGS
jgi:hypothetical protein